MAKKPVSGSAKKKAGGTTSTPPPIDSKDLLNVPTYGNIAVQNGGTGVANPNVDAGPSTVGPKPDPVGDQVKGTLNDGLSFGDTIANRYITDGSFGHIDANTSPEMAAFLARLKGQAETAGNYTGLENDSLAEARKGLAGYSDPQIQAFREQAQQEINRQYHTSVRDAMQNAARFGVRGPAATAQVQDLGVGKLQTQGNLERDLLVKNADAVERGRNAFSDLVRKTEDARFGRQNTADQNYGGSLTGEEQAHTGRQIFNVNQDTNRDVTRAGLAMSGAGLYAGQYSGQEAQNEAQRQFNEQLKQSRDATASNNDLLKQYMQQQQRQLNGISSSVGY